MHLVGRALLVTDVLHVALNSDDGNTKSRKNLYML